MIHDGIDTSFWRRTPVPDRLMDALRLSPETRVVTYVSRGLEAMRGFDILMKVAKRVCDSYPNVAFLVVGAERTAYGGDLRHTGGKSFKRWVFEQDQYDLERIRFLGNVRPDVLAQLLSLSDLHIYLTVPFVLSWSMLNAMACGCVVLASDTAPVREVVEDGRNGLLRGFFDVDALAAMALDVLKDPAEYRVLGEAARETIEERYALTVVLPHIVRLYEDVANRRAVDSPPERSVR